MKKQFDLKYYLAHPETKVVTRDGHNVRIISTDFRDPEFPVVAFITREDLTEFVSCFTISGELNAEEKGDLDLFFDLPDPVRKIVPLTYEDLYERVKQRKTMWVIRNCYVINIVDFDEEYIYFINGTNRERKIDKANYEYFKSLNAVFADGDPCWKEVEE